MSLGPDVLVTVVALLEDDRDLVEQFVEEVTTVVKASQPYYEIVLVDNGSGDDTQSEVQRLQQTYPNIHFIRLSRRYDSEVAFAAGLENSLGDYVIIMDIRHDPPDHIPKLLAVAAQGNEVVIGQTAPEHRAPLHYRLAESAFYLVASWCLSFPMDANASHFRCMSRQVVNSITRIRNKTRYLKYLNAVVGFRQAFIWYDLRPRRVSRGPHFRFLHSVTSGISVIVSNSAVPLRFASALALFASLVSVFYFGYILVVSLIKRKVAEGWITTNSITTLMFFLLFLVLTILAEYIARLLEEVQDRPLYFVEFDSYSSVTFYKKELSQKLNID